MQRGHLEWRPELPPLDDGGQGINREASSDRAELFNRLHVDGPHGAAALSLQHHVRQDLFGVFVREGPQDAKD